MLNDRTRFEIGNIGYSKYHIPHAEIPTVQNILESSSFLTKRQQS